jgi:hypothetical protein
VRREIKEGGGPVGSEEVRRREKERGRGELNKNPNPFTAEEEAGIAGSFGSRLKKGLCIGTEAGDREQDGQNEKASGGVTMESGGSPVL